MRTLSYNVFVSNKKCKMLISVLARNSGKGVLILIFDLYRAMVSGFNCNLDIMGSFHQITTYLIIMRIMLTENGGGAGTLIFGKGELRLGRENLTWGGGGGGGCSPPNTAQHIN